MLGIGTAALWEHVEAVEILNRRSVSADALALALALETIANKRAGMLRDSTARSNGL